MEGIFEGLWSTLTAEPFISALVCFCVGGAFLCLAGYTTHSIKVGDWTISWEEYDVSPFTCACIVGGIVCYIVFFAGILPLGYIENGENEIRFWDSIYALAIYIIYFVFVILCIISAWLYFKDYKEGCKICACISLITCIIAVLIVIIVAQFSGGYVAFGI